MVRHLANVVTIFMFFFSFSFGCFFFYIDDDADVDTRQICQRTSTTFNVEHNTSVVVSKSFGLSFAHELNYIAHASSQTHTHGTYIYRLVNIIKSNNIPRIFLPFCVLSLLIPEKLDTLHAKVMAILKRFFFVVVIVENRFLEC